MNIYEVFLTALLQFLFDLFTNAYLLNVVRLVARESVKF